MHRFILFLLITEFACFAAPPEIARQAAALQTVLQQADDAYYNRQQSLMSDDAYDTLREQYSRLISKWPELAEAPTVGAPTDSADKIPHPVSVLSLEKVYSDHEMLRFLEKTGPAPLYCIEPKLDGLTVVLHYHDGRLAHAATRGDGKTGSDVTAAILASGAVPTQLTHAPARLIIRGEAVLPFAAFDELNRRRTAEGLPALKSPRNAAAGTLRLTDYAEVARRNLSIRVFDLLASDEMPLSHSEALLSIKQLGLPIVESIAVSASQVLETVEAMNQNRANLPFQTDGIVVRVDNQQLANQLGSTSHHPRSAIARKYRQVPVYAQVTGVDWTRGKTGKLTPVAVFTPVDIQGATVQRATLHNLDYLRAMDLKIGDWVSVIRAGGSVPEITGVLKERRTGKETDIAVPTGS